METISTPTKTYKSFTYHTSVVWKDGRQGTLNATGKPALTVSSPPEFKGIPNVWTPEDLFVAAVEICQMSTFLSFGGRKGLPLISYASSAEGVLENVDGKYRFTTITVTPTIVVGNSWTAEQVDELVRTAHEHCLIGNSTSATVVVKPTIVIH